MLIKKEDLRKVKISEYPDGSGDHITKGYFHEWAKYPYSENGSLVQDTAALIELENGKIGFYHPNRIIFIDKF
jgi:hypothetical protein